MPDVGLPARTEAFDIEMDGGDGGLTGVGVSSLPLKLEEIAVPLRVQLVGPAFTLPGELLKPKLMEAPGLMVAL